MNYEVEFIKIFPCYYLISADCSAVLQLPQSYKHSESADLLRKSLLPHVWRFSSSNVLSCKHERLLSLKTWMSIIRKTEACHM